MAAAVQVRADYSGDDLRRLARRSDDADQTRRLLALAVILDGGSRGAAARTGGVGLQVIRDWVLRFNEGGPEALRTRKAPGKTPILTYDQRAALAAAVEAGPRPYLDGVVRWRLVDLAQWAHEELGVSVSRQTLGRALRAMGFRKLSARPQHYAQDEDAIAEFKKTSATSSRTSASPTAGRRSRYGSSVWFASGMQEETLTPDRPCFSVSGLFAGEVRPSHNGSRWDAFLTRRPDLLIYRHH